MKQEAENAKMAKLYREHVLGEKPPEGGFIPVGDLLGGIKAAPKVEVQEEETVLSGRRLGFEADAHNSSGCLFCSYGVLSEIYCHRCPRLNPI
jgi:hypothetical protein